MASTNILEKADAVSDDPVTDPSIQLFGNTVVEDSLREKLKEKHVGDSGKNNERRTCPENLDEERVECCKVILSSPPRLVKTTNRNDLSDTCTDSEDNEMRNTKIRVYYHKRMKYTVQLQEAVPDIKVRNRLYYVIYSYVVIVVSIKCRILTEIVKSYMLIKMERNSCVCSKCAVEPDDSHMI